MILPGEENDDPLQRLQCWKNDHFPQCNWDDRLWAYMCQASEELRVEWRDTLNDLVLYNLLGMGIFDWKGRNVRAPAAVPGMCLATAFATHLLPHILELEKKVLEESLG